MNNVSETGAARRDGPPVYGGMFLLCMSTLVYEISLTRVFSSLMYYHFASMAIALAFLGMGLGGIVVYLRPGLFNLRDGGRLVSLLCILYGLSVLALYLSGVAVTRYPNIASGFLTSFHQPYYQPFRQGFGAEGAGGSGLAALFGLAACTLVPFFLAGAVVSTLLTAIPGRAHTLYLADMLGAGLGALAVVFAIGQLGGPGALLLAAAGGFAAALSFSWGGRPLAGGRRLAASMILICAALAFAERAYGIVKFNYVGGRYEPGVIETRWNSYSRVLVYRGKTPGMQKQAWGVSRAFKGDRPEEVNIVINDTGYTTMVYDGPGSDTTYLKFDVTNLPFMLKGGGKTLVIGPGGGRDVLSALVFGSVDVTAVEVNPLLGDIVDGSFGEFTGRLYSRPGVKFVVDDGRSFLMRSKDKYDVIESARVYEWMEATSGAFTLSENFLYTKEAFDDYLGHLNDGGVLSITRFIFEKQAMRIVSLALASYGSMGETHPENCIAILKERGLATFLFKRGPFTGEELAALGDISARYGFEAVYLPGRDADNDFARYITAADKDAFVKAYPLDISPSTDDNPFLNFMVKGSAFWSLDEGKSAGGFHNRALMFLRDVFIVMGALSLLIFVMPLLFVRGADGGGRPKGLWRFMVYFGAIGVGFMLVEITFLRKFILFLGHPIYSLSVVLFVLLVCTGAGSALSAKARPRTVSRLMWLAPALVLLYVVLPDAVFGRFLGSGTMVRVAVSVAMLAPVGLLLGMMFPSGVKYADELGFGGSIPWFWAVNGVFSVFGTIFALVFAMGFGFDATVLAGGALYFLAALMFRGALGEKTGGDACTS